ncbi:MAG: translocation/assembly module TamB domain-containing protein [Bacteriovoracaceae bacterium]|nr:translocation/assembly module TamB domain-containing protein [Bacteriovoracaceae bacterium]
MKLNRLKKLFYIFVLFFIVSQFILWKILNSSYFASFISDILNQELAKNNEVKFKFNGLGVSFYPPGIEIENVEIESKHKIEIFDYFYLKSPKLVLQLHLFSHTGRKYRISNVELEGPSIEISFDDDWLKKNQHENNQWWGDQLQTTINNLMLQDSFELLRLAVSDAKVRSNWINLQSKEISLERNGKEYAGKLEIENVILLNKDLYEYKIPKINFLNFETRLSNNSLFFDKLELSSTGLDFNGQGEMRGIYSKNKTSLDFELKLKTNQAFIDYWAIPKYVTSGDTNLILKTSGRLFNPKIEGKIEVSNLNSKFADLSFASVTFFLEEEKIRARKIFLKDLSSGEMESDKLNLVYDFANFKFLNASGEVFARNFSLKSALKYVPSVANVIDGKISGPISVEVLRDHWPVKIFGKGAKAIDLSLNLDQKSPLLFFSEIQLNQFQFDINPGVKFFSQLKFGKSLMNVNGSIINDEINVSTDSFPIKLEEWRPIKNLQLKGEGNVKLLVSGPIDNAVMKFEQSIYNFSILDYYLGHAEGKWSIDLKKKLIEFEKINAVLDSGALAATGKLNLENQDLAFKINSQGINIVDIFKVLYPLTNSFDYIKNFAKSSIKADINMGGKFDLPENLQISGVLESNKISIMGEDFRDISTSMMMKNKNLIFDDIRLSKGKGVISSKADFDFIKKEVDASWSSENILLQDWNFYKKVAPALQSDVEIKGSLRGAIENPEMNGNLKLTKSQINGDSYPDSQMVYSKKNSIYEFDLNYMGGALNLKGGLDFTQDPNDINKKSYVEGELNSADWIPFINSLFSFENDDELLMGTLKSKIKSKFNLSNIATLDADLMINELTLTYPQIDLKNTNKNHIKINNGLVEIWDLRFLLASGDQFISKARGDFHDTVVIENILDLNLQKLNLFSNYYGEFFGKINTFSHFLWRSQQWEYGIRVQSKDFSLEGESGNLIIGKTNLDIEFKDSRILVNEFRSQMGAGTMSWIGSVDLSRRLMLPTDLAGQFQNVSIPYGTKSNVILKGNLALTGQDFNYLLAGDLSVVGGAMNNELEDFKFEKKLTEKKGRFLPANEYKNTGFQINYDVSISSERSYPLKNTQLDVKIFPSFSIKGEGKKVKLNGKINNQPDWQNIFMIKGNQFSVSKLDLIFDEKSEIEQFLFNCEAQSRINQHQVFAKIYGTTKDYKLELRSDPVLPEQSILSLIAFGYAEDVTQSLSESERSALSGVGIGSFLFDRLKLNQSLNTNLGLQLNVGTQYVVDSTSVLDGRNTANSSGSSNNVGRVRTATKLELKKKFSDKLNMSVSSTVGGTVGQRQSMNLNYSIDKNMFLDGVYDINTDQTGVVDRVGTSFGGDVKFKWTFK